jgi:hypothetical protein
MKKYNNSKYINTAWSNYLEYLLPAFKQHFKHCKTVLFIPYIRVAYPTEYTAKASLAFSKINIMKEYMNMKTRSAIEKTLKEFLQEAVYFCIGQ